MPSRNRPHPIPLPQAPRRGRNVTASALDVPAVVVCKCPNSSPRALAVRPMPWVTMTIGMGRAERSGEPFSDGLSLHSLDEQRVTPDHGRLSWKNCAGNDGGAVKVISPLTVVMPVLIRVHRRGAPREAVV